MLVSELGVEDLGGGHTGARVVIPQTDPLLLHPPLRAAGLPAERLPARPAVLHDLLNVQLGGVLLEAAEVFLTRSHGV